MQNAPDGDVPACYDVCRKEAYRLIADKNDGALIYPHVCIGPYEIDFLILHRDSNKVLHPIAVECDGHQFHEKTKQQAEYDKRRDRYLALHGMVVFRFTGTEIKRDPGKCAEELHRAVILGQFGPRECAWHGDPLSPKHQEQLEQKAEEERQEEYQRHAQEEARKEQERLDFIESEIMSGTYEGYYP